MPNNIYLQIPGPTNIPNEILKEISNPTINHRGIKFEELMENCLTGLKKTFKTKNNDVLIFPSSGSGILESVIVNLFSPGDVILAGSQGVFSERMAVIAEGFGLKVIRVNKQWGEAIHVEDIVKIFDNYNECSIKAICIPQVETSTGVENNIKEIAQYIRTYHNSTLVIVDAISSIGCVPLEADTWELDVVVTASQKGLMLPPGIGMVMLNDRAWSYHQSSTTNRWYWDYTSMHEKLKSYQCPYTPSTNLLFGLEKALFLLEQEGLESIWKRHQIIGQAVRSAVDSIGLNLFSKERHSNVVTAIKMPENIEFTALSKVLKDNYNVEIAGGIGKTKGKIFRIGHLASVSFLDVYSIMGALEMALFQLKYTDRVGETAKAVANTILDLDA